MLGLKGSYHGDTIGAMDACEGSIYNSTVESYSGRGIWFDPPTVAIRSGTVVTTVPWSRQNVGFPFVAELYNIPNQLSSPVATEYRRHIHDKLDSLIQRDHFFGALVLEALLMGAGGMIFVDPPLPGSPDICRPISALLTPSDL